MNKILKIGTRESELAVWQATLVKELLKKFDINSELIFIKSEGDIDLKTPLYEMGVQGIFTKTLDAALLNNIIDIAVHSMKDVPTQLAYGITQAAVLKRGNYRDVLVKRETSNEIIDLELTFSRLTPHNCNKQHSPQSAMAASLSESYNRKSAR